ncbi:MAG TPA: aminotransferase class V-fold PLP-dependent enzyme, partial [Fimbriimonadaceae bacterium]|nr:aminotransferase class V-fold PLP-dependent enzyme [Fimbriimonadaceae bacterium]
MPLPDIAAIRAQFPSLSSGFAYLENAGGSQVPAVVADAIREYMLSNYVQLGAGYEISRKSTAVVNEAHEWINTFMNGAGLGKVVLGPSSTQLLYMLAECYSRTMGKHESIIVAESGHEANIGPWWRLQELGFNVKIWPLDPHTQTCRLDVLEEMLQEPTRIVAFPQVSNLLGEIVDVRAVSQLAHRSGARVVVDGVAFAPHRAIDVAAWDADWYVYSTYKVFGPHMGAMFGKNEAFAEIKGPNHFFLPDENVYKFELG